MIFHILDMQAFLYAGLFISHIPLSWCSMKIILNYATSVDNLGELKVSRVLK